jgi:hypothetical protein
MQFLKMHTDEKWYEEMALALIRNAIELEKFRSRTIIASLIFSASEGALATKMISTHHSNSASPGLIQLSEVPRNLL